MVNQRWVGIFITAVACGCGAVDVEESQFLEGESRPLTISTYNIHHWRGGSDDEVSIERIAAVLDDLDADVVAVQEADNNLLPDGSRRQEVVAEMLGRTWVPIPGPDGDRLAVEGNALLISDEVEVVEVQWGDLSEEGRDPRAFVDAVLDVRGERVRVVGTHLGLNLAERHRQVDQIAAQLAIGSDADATLMMGDLNEWNPFAATFRPLTDRFRQARTNNTFPAGGPIFRLDRIWKSQNVLAEEVGVVRNELTEEASDHLPVRATLRF